MALLGKANPIRVFLVGLVVGMVLYGGVDYGLQLWGERTVRSVALRFVEAEYKNDRQSLMELATGSIASDVANGAFPDFKLQDVRLAGGTVNELCRDRAIVSVRVQPSNEDRYHIEQVTLQKDGGAMAGQFGST